MNTKLDKSNIENIMELTSTQQGILFHYINDNSVEYHEQISLTILGDIKIDLLQKAWNFVIETNEMLRTVFRWKGIEKPVQIVLKKHEILIQFLDLVNKLDKRDIVEGIKSKDSSNRIDITKETLRIYLCRLEDNKYEMIISNHHILYDGWSNGIILKELVESYNCLYKGKELKKVNKTKFNEFIKYNKLVNETQNKLFWNNYLNEYEVNDSYFEGSKDSRDIRRFLYSLSADTSNKVKNFSKENKVSLASVLYCTWGVILQKLNNSKDIVFGTIVSGRNVKINNVDEIVGLFINTIPMRLTNNDNKNLLELIRNVDCSIKERSEYENSSLVDINRYCNLKPNEDLFNTIVGIENYPIDFNLKNNNLLAIDNISIDARTNYNMTLEIRTFNNIDLYFSYNNNVISNKMIHKLGVYFEKIVQEIISYGNRKVTDIEMISKEEKSTILCKFNNNFIEYPKDKTIQELFEIQSKKTPSNIAVVFEDKRLTYRELNEKANKLARTLINNGVKSDTIVGILVEPSVEMIVGIMAILKAGGAYLPIDTDYPKERIKYILKNSGTKVLLTSSTIIVQINENINVLNLDDEKIYQNNYRNLEVKCSSDNLSYVIYTSGTTGYPKGVLIEHKNVVNLAFSLFEDIYSKYGENLNVALVASYVFDASVQQIFPTLLFGNTLFIVPKDIKKDGTLLLKYYNDKAIDISDGTPVHINMLNNVDTGDDIKLPVKHFIIGGDVFNIKEAHDFYNKYKLSNINFTNVYGPTECCVDSTAYHFNRHSLNDIDKMPIGRPMHNESVYILGKYLEILPIAVVGEIYLSGAGVGRGYLNNDILTKEKFIKYPFNNNEILYKTGDYGRWTENGEIEFYGRKDHQVKIRGFRIELGEIENKLLNYKKNEIKNEVDEITKIQRCNKCLLTSEYPNIEFNEKGVCSYCTSYEGYKEKANMYFEDILGLEKIIEKSKKYSKGEYDCLLLYSGGKDSSYVLYRLVEMGLKVLAFTFDNGYISETAFENIKRTTSRLKVDSIISNSENMDKIFLESLKTDSTVCTGCFKALTAISTKIAYEKGIGLIITGLSRGQILDTKLLGIYSQGIFSPDEVEKRLLLFRKMYHSVGDKTAELLKVDLNDEKFFDKTFFVDFFRYENISSHEIKEYLKKKDEFWSLPGDTGFCSTNCLINDVGIYVHLNNKRYHNYESPLSWDCRLGQLDREAGLNELEPTIDEEKVQSILKKIGYNTPNREERCISKVVVLDREDDFLNKYLCAYFVSDEKLSVSELREYLSTELPEYMVPSYFIGVSDIPITVNGKIDRSTLIKEKDIIRDDIKYIEPRNEIEKKVQEIWSEILRIEKISIDESFFDLGGHSLNAMLLVSKIHKVLNVEVPLKELFKLPTIKGISEFIASATENTYSKIGKVEEMEYYEVSSAQKRMYMLQQFDRNSTAYNISAVFIIEGKINEEKIEKTLRKLILRHEALRTYFETIDNEIVQKIDSACEFILTYRKDSRDIDAVMCEFIRPFELGQAPLFRAELVKNQEKIYLLIDMHHIISDGVSMEILIKEFIELHDGQTLKPLRLQYKDFAAWQNNLLNSEEVKKQKEYWIDRFKDELPVLNMPTDYIRPAIQKFDGDSINFIINRDMTAEIRKIAKETGSTTYMVILSALNILLSKYSGQEDIIIGTPIAGRSHADLEKIMGMFVNTLAMRNYPEGEKSYEEFLKEVKENALKAYENQDYQFEDLVDSLNTKRDISRNPIFDVMFSMQSMGEDIETAELKFKKYENSTKIAKFDITLSAYENKECILLNYEYSTNLFKKETIKRMAGYFDNVLKKIIANRNIKINEIEIVGEEEKYKILNEFNDTYVDYPKDKTFHELFEEQVEKTPNNTAVVFKDKQLTYRELNEKSNQLARVLRRKGVKSESIVGIMVERSLEMLIGIIGIIKSGAAYLPIDPEYPEERIKYMLEDGKANIFITNKHLINKIEFNGQLIDIEDNEIYVENTSNLKNIAQSNNLVYVIYTSGTTGNPKGVMIEHRSLINAAYAWRSHYKLNEFDVRLLQIASMSFDVFAGDLCRSLLNGGTMYVIDNDMKLNMGRVYEVIAKYGINIFESTPSYIITFINYINENNLDISNINILILGSDNCPLNEYKNILDKYGRHMRVLNSYGVTEATIDSSYYEEELNNICNISNTPIGKPLNNTQFYILNNKLITQPIGVYGELFIGGDGISRGYLGKEKLTAEKFIGSPFNEEETMYRTGDLARWLPDGNIEFLGRIDNQVKIRGFRIELGEIENQILNYGDIKEVVVIDREYESGNKYLCAYIVCEKELEVAKIKEYLGEKLPDYMVPLYFMEMEKIPLTSNGKVDRKALPEPNYEKDILQQYEAPRNEIEKKLVDLWQETLGISKVGINDNFFDLGGHSLKVIVLVSKIHKELNVEVPIKEIFMRSTIKSLSEYISSTKKSIYFSIKPAEEKEYYEASSAQKRMYMLQQFELQSIGYNMPCVMEVEGKIDICRLERVIEWLIERHESFRTSFEERDEEIVQKINKDIKTKINYIEVRDKNKDDLIKEFIKPFDLSKAPLFRVGLLKLEEEKHIIMFDMHHIIADGASLRILVEEFASLYEGKELKKLRIQYKDYSEWKNNFMKSEIMKKQEQYWVNRFKGYIPILNMPTDYERPAVQNYGGDSISFIIEDDITEKIRNLARETESTMYMVLLSAFNILLSKYSGQEDIVIGTPIAGRLHVDLNNVIGMFVNTLALRNKPEGEKIYIEFLKELKEISLKAYENQDYQFDELVDNLKLTRDISRNPLFDVMFIMENIDMADIEIKELKFTEYEYKNKISKFDFSLSAVDNGSALGLTLTYNTTLFKMKTAEKITNHYKNIIGEIIEKPYKKINEINMLSEQENTELTQFIEKKKNRNLDVSFDF